MCVDSFTVSPFFIYIYIFSPLTTGNVKTSSIGDCASDFGVVVSVKSIFKGECSND